jgi:membrane-associated phospholipid phosphatase
MTREKLRSYILQQLALLLLVSIMIVLCYFFVDRQIVIFFHEHHARQWPFLHQIANGSISIVVLLFFSLSVFVWLKGGALLDSTVMRKIYLIMVAVATSYYLKVALKSFFSRTWTDTFICQNPSFLQQGVYGFNWLTKHGPAYESFPSGHATVITATMLMVGSVAPHLRRLSYVVIAMVCTAQVVLYYHFLSDVLGGIWLGSVVAMVVHKVSVPRR